MNWSSTCAWAKTSPYIIRVSVWDHFQFANSSLHLRVYLLGKFCIHKTEKRPDFSSLDSYEFLEFMALQVVTNNFSRLLLAMLPVNQCMPS